MSIHRQKISSNMAWLFLGSDVWFIQNPEIKTGNKKAGIQLITISKNSGFFISREFHASIT